MGETYGYKCENCGHHFAANLGEGLMFPITYNDFLKKVKDGTYGVQGKEFFEAFPDGAIDAEIVLARCKKCGEYYGIPNLALYVPKDEKNPYRSCGRWSSAMMNSKLEYLCTFDLKMHYIKFEEYHHKCEKCQGELEIIKPNDADFRRSHYNIDLKCPQCGKKIELRVIGNWD